jgi:Cysteine-rich secretory protein family
MAAQTQISRNAAIQPEAGQIVALANQARAAAGARPLEWDPALASAARQHCLRMAAEGPISHRYGGEPSLEERAWQAGAHFGLIEENVAIGPTPAAIHSEWMNSPGHRSNLLNPDVDRVGVAVVASRGVLYAVADYERAVPLLAPTQVETAIAGLLHNSGITPLENSADARASCVDGHAVKTSRPPGFFMLWQGTDVTHLPAELVNRISSGRYRQAEVGSCPAQSVDGSFTAYRVAVLLY